MGLQSGLRVCYRQIAAYRYIVISVLAITFVVLVSWTQEDTILRKQNEPQKREADRQWFDLNNKPLDTSLEGPPIRLIKIQRQPQERKSLEDSRGQNLLAESTDKPNEIPVEDHTNKIRETCAKSGPASQVILLTYGRSGSSLTADILQQHSDVFFYYEPLHNLAKTFTHVQNIFTQKYGRHLYLTAIDSYNKEAEKVTEMLLTCNYTHLPSTSYKNLHLVRSENTRPLNGCIRRAQGDEAMIKQCLQISSNKCHRKPIKLVKTIRMTVESVGKLMTRNPHLKMVYLIRDPRGSYVSKLKAFPKSFSKNATYEAVRICPRLKKDIDNALNLSRKYPDRVHITRYETIAENPVDVSRKLYNFLCLKFTPEIENYILTNTMSGDMRAHKDIYSVKRNDTKSVSYAWRSKMNIAHAVAFDEVCSDVYSQFGYLPVDNEEHLRDLDIPLKFDKEFIL